MMSPYNPLRILFYPMILILLGVGIYFIWKKNPALMDQLSLIEKQRNSKKSDVFVVKTASAEAEDWAKPATPTALSLNNDLAHPESLRVDHRYDFYKEGLTLEDKETPWWVDAKGFATATASTISLYDTKAELSWTLTTNEGQAFCDGIPAITAEAVFICYAKGGMSAFSREKGLLIWTRSDKHTYWRHPISIGSQLYTFRKNDEKSWSLGKTDLNTGEEKLELKGLPTELSGDPVFSTQRKIMVLLEKAGGVRAYDLSTMKPLWKSDITNEFHAPAAISGDRVYIVTSEGVIHALELRTGNAIWEYSLNQPCGQNLAFAESIMIGAITDDNGYLHMMDLRTGKRKWRFNTKTANKIRKMSAVRLEAERASKLNMGAESRGWLFWGPCKDYELCAFEPFKGLLLRRIESKDPVGHPPLYMADSNLMTYLALEKDGPKFKIYADRDLIAEEEQKAELTVDKPEAAN